MSTKKGVTKPMNFEELVAELKGSEAYDKEVLRSEISDQISRLMDSEHISNAELARRLGKSRAYVTKILQGNANFTLDSLVQIARVLGCKYVPIFVPVNLWKKIEAIQLSAQVSGSASLSETYTPVSTNKPLADETDTLEFSA
jgi:transcriptional regulator with XRE-family HTH domain